MKHNIPPNFSKKHLFCWWWSHPVIFGYVSALVYFKGFQFSNFGLSQAGILTCSSFRSRWTTGAIYHVLWLHWKPPNACFLGSPSLPSPSLHSAMSLHLQSSSVSSPDFLWPVHASRAAVGIWQWMGFRGGWLPLQNFPAHWGRRLQRCPVIVTAIWVTIDYWLTSKAEWVESSQWLNLNFWPFV